MIGSACAMPDLPSPEMATPMPDAFDVAGTPVYLPLDHPWWTVFDDPRLNAVVASALQKNLSIVQAVEKVVQAREVLQQQKAARLPGLEASADARRNRSLTGAFSTVASVGLSAAYEVGFWGRIHASEASAAYLAQAGEYDLQTLYMTLAGEVVQLYMQCLYLSRLEELTRNQVVIAKNQRDALRRRYETGLSELSDVLAAESSLVTAKAALPGIVSDRRIVQHALQVLTGEWPESSTVSDPDPLPDVPLLMPGGLPSEIVYQRPDIRAAFFRIQSADRNVAAAVAERFPRFRLTGGIGHNWTQSAGPTLDGMVWNLGAGITGPVLDWGQRKSAVQQRASMYRSQVAAWQESVLTAFQEIADALSQNERSEAVVALRESQLETAQKDYRLTARRYEMGLSTYSDLLAAEQAVNTVTSTLLSASYTLLTDRILLAKRTGGDWTKAVAEARLNR